MWGESTCYRLIPIAEGQWCRRRFSCNEVIIFDFWSVDSPFNIAALASVIFRVPNYHLFEPFYVWKIKCTEIIYALWWPDITRKLSSVGTPWWRHQMETFSKLLVLCKGKSPVTIEFPLQSPVMRSFLWSVFFDLHLNKRLSKQSRRRWFETPSR